MAHSHRHHHHCYHHHRYYGGGSGGSFLAVLIMLGILFAIVFAMTAYYFNIWNGGLHKCGRKYTYDVCNECGYIEDIYCVPCNYHKEIPEWYKLEEK